MTKVTYIIHRYAGTDEDRTVTVTDKTAEEVSRYRSAEGQRELGITILSIEDDAA
jgi:hypothetical protein